MVSILPTRRKDPTATRFDRLTHSEVLQKGLAVMDVAAVALARENSIPIIVFSIHEKGGFAEILTGGGRGDHRNRQLSSLKGGSDKDRSH